MEAGVFAMLALSRVPTWALTSLSLKSGPGEKSLRFFWSAGWSLPQVSLSFPTSATNSQLVGNYAQLVVRSSLSFLAPDQPIYVELCLDLGLR